ncbi:MAG: hypothetical protein J7647_24175 [Cyanobacteria bacterium SBLK]|nr:hypothetical protein [Cyanobacteria bacterium SBLK]
MYESDRESEGLPNQTPVSWIARHPMLFWGGLWTIALSVTVGVTVGLLHGRLFAPQRSLNIPPPLRKESLESGNRREETWNDFQEHPETRSFQDANSSSPTPKTLLPLWLIGAIALSCSVGSFFVTLVLKSLSFSQVSVKRLHPVRPSSELPAASTPRFQAQFGATPYQAPIIAETQPTVTVLPPEAVTPLDSPQNDGNLLEQLDLRKRHSLSSLMEYSEEESL